MDILTSKNNGYTILLLTGLFFVIILASFIMTNSKVDRTNEYNMELHVTSLPILVGNRTVVQLLIYDSTGNSLDHAKVKINFTNGTTNIKKNTVFRGNGLYETELRFFDEGKWTGYLEWKKGNSFGSKEVHFSVERIGHKFGR